VKAAARSAIAAASAFLVVIPAGDLLFIYPYHHPKNSTSHTHDSAMIGTNTTQENLTA
jgi:p-aminobenzoyl-glutamate transporter AbgT